MARVNAWTRALRGFVKRNHLTKTGFGRGVGVTHPTVIAWLNGDKDPTDANLRAVEIFTGGEVAASLFPRRDERDVKPFTPPQAARADH